MTTASEDRKAEGKRLVSELRAIMANMMCQGVPMPELAMFERRVMALELELERATR